MKLNAWRIMAFVAAVTAWAGVAGLAEEKRDHQPAAAPGQPQPCATQPATARDFTPLSWRTAGVPGPCVSDRSTCICDQITSGGVGWCSRHGRGFAYGHVLRTWPLFRTLLPTDDGSGNVEQTPHPGCTAHGTGEDEAGGDEHETHYYGAVLLSHESLLLMLNAVPRAGGPKGNPYRVEAIPGYCPETGQYLVMGRWYRSWIVPAMEAGRLLPGLRKSATAGQTGDDGAQVPVDAAGERPAEGAATADAGDPVPGCEFCRQAFAAGAVWSASGFPVQPFCEKCGVGVVAGRVFIGREAYELARAADGALDLHRLHRCERCGIGVLAGGRCDVCSECKKCHAGQ
ncbi:MAG: hypothetical protein PVJ57_06065 [Phycisphaerae bacterium]|jgi:hypothetical protein